MKECGTEQSGNLPSSQMGNHTGMGNNLIHKFSLLEKDYMQASVQKPTVNEGILQLLLFVDRSSRSQEQVIAIRQCLKNLKTDFPFDLKIVDVGQEPYLAEHFKLVATPALIKIYPTPRHTLAGSNLVGQLEKWWPRWQRSINDPQSNLLTEVDETANNNPQNSINSIACSVELIRIADELFRLQQEKAELEAQLMFKDRIIEMLAHDLRNPLTATSIALETIELCSPIDGPPDPRLTPALMHQLIKHARNQTRNIDRMIADLLEAAKGANAEFHIYPQKLDLKNLCQEIFQDLQDRFTVKYLLLQTDIPKDLPPVYADEERVRQVIVNLLDNAIKYTPNHGTIEVSIVHRTTQKVQISICDNGPGIPEAKRDQIFENHFRLDRDEKKEGYGIGLSLCQRIVRAHYGQIWVEPGPQAGSCFKFTLPVYR